MSKVTCELRALETAPGSAGADGGPAGATSTKCCGLSAGEADAGTVLIEESAATLTQFLLGRLVLQSGKEAKGPLVSQEVQETHKFAVKARRPKTKRNVCSCTRSHEPSKYARSL